MRKPDHREKASCGLDEGLRKSDHREKASCGLKYRYWKNRTTERKQAVVWNIGIGKSRPLILSKPWSGNEGLRKPDHREKARCGLEMKA